MLVLSRKIGESIMVGDDVEVRVTRVGKGRVTLVVSAPEAVRIRRSELPVVYRDEPMTARPCSAK